MNEDKRKYFRDYYNKRKAYYLNILGGKCIKCGSTEDLQFDHIQPRERDRKNCITSLLKSSNEKILKELEKCQVLCKGCHLIKSTQEGSFINPWNKGKWSHGTSAAYMEQKCRCLECKKAYSTYKSLRRKERGWK